MEKLSNKIISVTELRRNFGAITKDLPRMDSLILTRGGKPFATLKAVPEEKMRILKKAAGAWKNTKLDSDIFWEKVLKRKSRKAPIAL